MNQVVVWILFVLSLTSFAAAATLDELRACIDDIRKSPFSDRELINRCYNKALPWAHSSSLEGRALYFQVLPRFIQSGYERADYESLVKKMTDYYRAHLQSDITPQAIGFWSDPEIQAVYEGISSFEFYASKIFVDDVAIQANANILANLELRNLATRSQVYYLYSSLLAYGKWSEAQVILKRFPEFLNTPIPKITNPVTSPKDSLGYYAVSSDLQSMTLKTFDLTHGPRIVFLGFCHFAVDMIRVLSKESDFNQIMSRHGIVINPNNFVEFDFKKMDELRNEFPAFEFHPVANVGAWFQKGVHTLASPTVLFFLDGKAIYEMPGFNLDSAKDFCRGLKSIGLSAPNACSKH